MHSITRQSVMAMIESIEHQLSAIKTVLFMQDGSSDGTILPKREFTDPNYTSADEDRLIEDALSLDQDEKEKILQDIARNTEPEFNDDPEQY